MICSQIRSQLSEYLDAELPVAQAQRVEAHLMLCPHCRREWETLRAAVRLVSHLGGEKCPVDLRPSVLMAVAENRPEPRRPQWRPMLFSAAVAAALAALVIPTLLTLPRAAVEVSADRGTLLGEPAPHPPLHDQFDLTTSLGTADGLMLSMQRAEAEPVATPAAFQAPVR